MEKNKVIIYENDLKFKQHSKIDFSSNLIEFSSDEIKTKLKQNLDTIEYRINDAKKNNFIIIDLSYLSLFNLNQIFTSEHYKNCEILFLNNNNLSGTVDFSKFCNLKVLDIQTNNIKSIILPKSLIELSASDNLIEELQSDLPNLERLLINNNKLKTLKEYENLLLLECAYNSIELIKFYPKIKKIIVNNNPLKSIVQLPFLSYLDIAECPIDNIPTYNNLKHLLASNTKLSSLKPQMINLEFIEIIGTPIKRLTYFENFDCILLSSNLTNNISSKYKTIANAIINQKGVIVSISKNFDK
jgi:hypothetical protein